MESSKNQHVQVPNSVSSLQEKKDGRTVNKEYSDLNTYAQLKKYMNNQTKTSLISVARLAQDCDLSSQGTINSLKRLEESGDIQKLRIGKCNGYKFNTNSEKFEMYDHQFLNNKELTSQQKAVFIAIQKYSYIDKENGIAKTSFSIEELAQKTGISKATIYRRVDEMIKNNFISKRSSSDKNGNSCEVLEFNLPKFGQYVLCKIEQHDVIIAQQQMELDKLKSDMEIMKKIIKNQSIVDIDIDIIV